MSIRSICIFPLLVFAWATILTGQSNKYEIELEPLEISDLSGIQSFAYGLHQDYLLILGGRVDGLHRRQPFAAFDADGNNASAIVVDLEGEQLWSVPLTSLPVNLREQLSSTNMQFHQSGDHLILTGGYAYSPSAGDHITFPYITVIDVPVLIDEVIADTITTRPMLQAEDEQFAVTGGRLEYMNGIYYLAGGHRFDGRYNPMGPNHGPGFEQAYTNEVRRFTVDVSGGVLQIEHRSPFHDERHLHRRDYNLLPQLSDGEEHLMMFSGVFQTTADVPWLYPVKVESHGITPIEDFSQLYNHYHCAALPIYNEAKDEMHNIFFGGIAQFYDEDGILVQDNDVPFVSSIADVAIAEDGSMTESLLETAMPDLLGAGSEFVVSSAVGTYSNGVVMGDLINESTLLAGYIVGGIRSTARNIFFVNDGGQSVAIPTIYKVYLRRTVVSATDEKLSQIEKSLMIYPNPASKVVRMAIDLEEPMPILVKVLDASGKLLGSQSIDVSTLESGRNHIVLDKINPSFGKWLYVIEVGGSITSRWVHWSE